MQAYRVPQGLFPLAGLLFYGAALVVLLAIAAQLLIGYEDATRGIELGEPPQVAWSGVYPLGVNVALEQYRTNAGLHRVLELIKAGGFRWIRQTFPWSEIEPLPGRHEWAPWDRIVEVYPRSGAVLIAVLDTSPAWARERMDADNPYAPSRDFEDYFDFVRAFVARYRERIDFYQVWEEPNIHPHWGERYVDPRAYVEMLRGAALAIREADPDAVILNAALAPNVEAGGRNMSDVLFLQEMYEAGARPYFDVLAIQPYGFWSGPEDRALDASRTNFSRAILLRGVMERNRDANKAVFAVEFGWNALPVDWQGNASPWGTDAEALQAQRTIAAVERAQREWPWMGAMLLAHLQPPAAPDDPVWGFALIDPAGQPRRLYGELAAWSGGAPFYPGTYSVEDPAYASVQWWAAVDGDALTFEFWGTRVDLEVQSPFRAQVEVDEAPPSPVSVVGDGLRRAALVSGLPEGRHRLRIVVGEGAIAGASVQREANLSSFLVSLGLIAAVGAVVSWRGLRLLLSTPMRELAARLDRRYRELPEGVQAALLGGAILAYYFTPVPALSLAWLALAALLIYLRLDWGLIYTTFSIPFFLRSRLLWGRSFSTVEILTLICFAAWLLRALIRPPSVLHSEVASAPTAMPGRPWGSLLRAWMVAQLRTINSLDGAVAFFWATGLFSLLVAENFGVAAREFRVVILEPVLFYWLVRSAPKARNRRLLDALVGAGVAIALIGLYQYFLSGEVITAEGVRRIRAFYGSPNNLALFLVRVAPIALAFAWASRGFPRWLYAAASAVLVIALVLTYSRGALFLGLPAGWLALGALRGRRALIAGLAGAALWVGIAFFAAGPERVSSLLNPSEGTTFRRLKLWEASLEMLGDHPWFGVGLDNFLYQYPRYVRPEAAQEPDLSHPHNLVLHWWLSLGLPGVIALVWLSAELTRRGLRLYREHVDPQARVIILALSASLVAGLAHGLVDQSYFLVDLAFVFTLSLGMVRHLERELSSDKV